MKNVSLPLDAVLPAAVAEKTPSEIALEVARVGPFIKIQPPTPG